MKNLLNKAMLTLVVFGLAIVSSFAMDTNPPAEPVKTTVEAEVVADNLEKPTLLEEGYGYYDDFLEECVLISEGSPGVTCLITNDGDICTEFKDGLDRDLYYMSRATEHDDWVCGEALRKPLVN